jgi:hypothetical protein
MAAGELRANRIRRDRGSLSFEISHLHVMGMTFYHGGGHLFPESPGDLHPLKNPTAHGRDQSGLGHFT